MAELTTGTDHLRFSLCLDPVYTDYDYYDRIKIAAEQGFDGIELWDISSLDPDKVRQTCESNGIAVANVNALNAWDIHMACSYPAILKNMLETFHVTAAMDAKNILVLAGMQEGRLHNQETVLAANLARLSECAEKEQIQVSIEPLNTLREHKGYALDTSAQGFDIIKTVNHPLIRLVFDIYHMQIMEGNIISNMINNLTLIGHVHTAGCPGRHEHFYGENDYPNILRHLADAGYKGYIGCEYFPSYDSRQSTADVLKYLKSYEKKHNTY